MMGSDWRATMKKGGKSTPALEILADMPGARFDANETIVVNQSDRL